MLFVFRIMFEVTTGVHTEPSLPRGPIYLKERAG